MTCKEEAAGCWRSGCAAGAGAAHGAASLWRRSRAAAEGTGFSSWHALLAHAGSWDALLGFLQ